MRGASSRRTATTSSACSRGTRYSLCSSSPLLGVKASWKWGSRSYQAPGTPSCGVHTLAAEPGQRVPFDGGRGGPEEGRSDPTIVVERPRWRCGRIDPALAPDLRHSVTEIVGEQTDAVGAGHHVREVVLELGPGQV